MIASGCILFLFPVVCKVTSFEDDLTWRTSELPGSTTEKEEKMKESIVYIATHADSAISQWRRKSNTGSGLLIFFGFVTFLATLNRKPEPVTSGQRR